MSLPLLHVLPNEMSEFPAVGLYEPIDVPDCAEMPR
jgi:hypothetical protein